MRVKDNMAPGKGTVTPVWVNLETGERRPFDARANQLTFECATALANLFAGNYQYTPRYIGVLYGPDATPAGISTPAARDHTWEAITANTADIGGNIQIAPITRTPTVLADGEYTANSVIFNAHTRTGAAGEYAFQQTAPFSSALVTGKYIYHAILLAKPTLRNTYLPLARVTLGAGGTYAAKPDGFELSVEWQISFF